MLRPRIHSMFTEVVTVPTKSKIQVDNRFATAEKRMTLPQQRILMGLLSLNLTGENFGRFKITLKGLLHLAGLSTWRNKRAVIDVMVDISQSVLIIPEFEKDKGGGIGTAVINPIPYAFWNEQTDIVFFELNEKLKELLLELKENFTLVGLKEFQQLRSSRACQLFFLASYCKNLNEARRTFDVPWLTKYLSIKEGTNWNDSWSLIRRSVDLVRQDTSFNIVLIPHKRGFDKRKVSHITLSIREYPNLEELKVQELVRAKKEREDQDRRLFLRRLRSKKGGKKLVVESKSC